MTKKMVLCSRAAEILRNADYCVGPQFVVIFGRCPWNCQEHRIGKTNDGLYRIDDKNYKSGEAMTMVKGFLMVGAYTLTDMDYTNIVHTIVRENTSDEKDYWGVEASEDCENHIDFLVGIGKSTNDLFQDALAVANERGLDLVM